MLVDYVRVYKYVAAPPDAPTGLSASAGNGKVVLNWDASDPGATGYNIQRADTSGGPYTLIASTTANGYADTTVANCSDYFYVVTATNSLGRSPASIEAGVSLGAFALAVNSGGSATDPFIADAFFSGGTASTTANTIDTSGVTAPAPQAVYQSERYGNFTYAFTGLTPGLSYTVRLHFAEFDWSSVGQRVFNVFINGAKVLSNFDIIAVTGAKNEATVQQFTAAANGSGQITIQFATVTDNAKVSGIELLLPRTAAPVVGNNGPIWAGTTLNLTASAVAGATYHWTGPNGFTATAQNPSIPHATTNASGLYSVTATIGGCASAPATTAVTVNPPVSISVQSSNASLTLNWPGGTLQSATNLAGPWSEVSGATAPYPVAPTEPARFYRVKLQ